MSPTLAAIFILFNGHNLDGWNALTGEWTVENSAIVCKSESGSILSSFESTAYSLTFECRISRKGRCQIRTRAAKDGTGGTVLDLWPLAKEASNQFAIPDAPVWLPVRLHIERSAAHGRANSEQRGRGFIVFETDQPGFAIRNIKVTEPGFENLFDGKSTKGWEPVGRHDPDNPTWYVENGTLICRHTKWGNWLRTVESYDNFILRLEYWLPKGGNSGIYLHAPATSERISQIGQEIQLIDDRSWKIKPAQRNGSVYAGIAPEVEVPAPAGEWNAIEVFFQGRRIRTTVNGVQLYDARLDDDTKDAKLLNNPLATRRLTGFIGLQDHTDSPKFRNIRIRTLPPESQPAG